MQGLNLVRANTEDSSVLLSDDPCEIPSHKIRFNFQKKAIKLENKVSFNALFLEVIFISMRGFFYEHDILCHYRDCQHFKGL